MTWDENNLEKMSISSKVEVSSISTGIKKRDKHLRSKDFFNAKKHPHITFKSTKVKKVDANEYMVYGELTMKDTTRSVKMPVEVIGRGKGPGGKNRIGLEGSLTVDRFDYNLEWKKKIANGTLIVSDKVKILLDLQLIQK